MSWISPEINNRKARVIVEFNDLDKAWRFEKALKEMGIHNVSLEIPKE